MTRTIQTPLPTPIQGKADWRKYKAFRLQNGVTCLVIQDQQSKTTAMSCIVEVGASADPRELSGLAHFCEHMCFLGSQKYPGENEYKRYLASHGGRSNASTSMHLTNYKFEVLADHAETAVDIFSNFFVAPLFTASGTEREVQAVNSENSKNLTADGRRRLQILKDIADPLHYYSKFSTGNKETLPTDNPEKVGMIRQALLAFHKKHYRPEKMTVVIAGPQSIETLEEWVGERYSSIQPSTDKAPTTNASEIETLIENAAKDVPNYAFDDPAPPYNPAFKPSLLQTNPEVTNENPWPVLLTTKPLRSMRRLAMMFPIPSDRKHPDQSPSRVLSHLLGHEGVGSAFAALQNDGLLSSLSAGARVQAPDFTLFQIDMGLTKKGEDEWERVVGLIFAYCRMLQKKARQESDTGDLKRIWKEMSDLDKIFFNETSPGGAYAYVPGMCNRMVTYGAEACLSAGCMLNETEDTFPMTDFIDIVDRFVPENCIIERCSEGAYKDAQKHKDTTENSNGFGLRTEKWYGVEYFLTPINDEIVSSWKDADLELSENHKSIDSADLNLPLPNRYIPRTLELCSELPDGLREGGQNIEKPIDPPKLIIDEENWKLYHRLDDRYLLPKSSLHLLIRNMSTHSIKNDDGNWLYDVKSSLYSSLLASVFNEAMAQETYDAELAGMQWSLSLGSSGIKLRCFGFSDRLPNLALKVLDDFLSGEFLYDEKFFLSSKDRLIRGLETYFESRRADAHARYYRNALLCSEDEGVDESLEIAIASTFQDIVDHHGTILRDQERSVQCLFSGNVSSTEATDFFSSAKSKIQDAYKSRGLVTIDDRKETLVQNGGFERQIHQGHDIELHFNSKNLQEENGAVLCTFQSSIPSFKGETISHPLALRSSSSIRLLCHIIREPLFNSLRTKQQLGYIVSSSYEIGISSQSNENGQIPITTPIDFISINVLSQKIAPPEIVDRIDEFITVFRKSLETMPESEINDHANSLATKLLKPIQKLQTEASLQNTRIQRYGPEVYYQLNHENNMNDVDKKEIPWDTTKALASTIRGLRRQDLLETFDRMTHPSTRSRLVSCVYGKKFPLKPSAPQASKSSLGLFSLFQYNRTTKIVDSFPNLLKHRAVLPKFSAAGISPRNIQNIDILSTVQKHQRRAFMVGLGIFGATVLGMTMLNHSSSDKAQKRSTIKLTK